MSTRQRGEIWNQSEASRRENDLVWLLSELDQALNWAWAWTIDGEVIN